RLGCDRGRLAARLSRGEAWIGERRAGLARSQTRLDTALGALEAGRRAAAVHAGDDPPALCAGEVAAARAAAEDAERAAADALARLEHQVRTDDDRRARVAELAPRRAQQARRHRTWAALSDVIGSADGKKLKVFAQSLTLDALLAAANHHLVDLAPRYRVMRVPGTDLDLQIVDDDLGAEVRSVNSLSGGESFLVSLALALGLSSLSTRAVRVETLFVDEGFGTLDRDTLDHAVVALEGLHARGRTVGIISHVPELQERLGVQVRVEPVGTGRSRVVTMARGTA
ncbi:MAG TPA: SbcC/MukB-like Walker B domain-containing protein, partial [Anaeromyxobacteraceae bacterium]